MSTKKTRIERKFVFGKDNKENIEKFLLINNFKKAYPDRKINSIYLDTENLDNVRDNINGVSNRKKFRIRWYNDDIKKMYFEIKNKKNFNVWKNIFKIKYNFNKETLVEDLKKYFYDLKNHKINSHNYNFILLINYFRSYWLSKNRKIRATIDNNISTKSLCNNSNRIDLNDTVLEFKFSPIDENYFRELSLKRNLNIRTQKYSKYVRSFISLENSGLIKTT